MFEAGRRYSDAPVAGVSLGPVDTAVLARLVSEGFARGDAMTVSLAGETVAPGGFVRGGAPLGPARPALTTYGTLINPATDATINVQNVTTVTAGVSAPAPLAVRNPRGNGISGWGQIYQHDGALAFDRVVLHGMARNAGLSGDDLWATLLVEVVECSNRTNASAVVNQGVVLARGTLELAQGTDAITSDLSVPMTDPAGRPIVLGPTNLPRLFCVRYSTQNADGTRAVAGDSRTASTPTYVIADALDAGVPGVAAGRPGVWYQSQATGNWVFNSGALVPGLSMDLVLSDTTALPDPSPLCEGWRYLHGWRAALARLLDGQAAPAVIAALGDSWVAGETRWLQPLARQLKTRYGDAGPGYVGVALSFGVTLTGGSDAAQASVARSGSGWVDADAATTTRGVDGQHTYNNTVGDAVVITISGTARRGVLHYYRQPAGGGIRWRLGAGTWTSISTAGTAGHATATLDFGAEVTGQSLRIEIETTGADGTILHGVDLQRDVAGVRVAKLGNSGSQCGKVLLTDEAIQRGALSAIAPHLVVLCWATNEQQQVPAVSPDELVANLRIMIRRVRQAVPYVDILLFSPGPLARYGDPWQTWQYRDAVRALATEQGCAWINCEQALGTWSDAQRGGLMADTVHPSSVGGQVLAGVLMRELLAGLGE